MMTFTPRAFLSAFSAATVAMLLTAAPVSAQSTADATTTATAVTASAAQPVVLDLNQIDEQLTTEGSASNGLRQKVIHNSSDTTLVLLSFEANGKKDDHAVPGTATIQVVDGSIDFEVLGKTHALSKGNIIILQPNTEHNLTAKERSRVLVTINK